MALTTINFTSTFQFETTPKNILLTDSTDYAGQGVAKASCKGVIKVVDPLGDTIYNNVNYAAPDVTPNVSLNSTIAIPITLDVDGVAVPGDYIITYSIQDSTGTLYIISLTKTFDLSYVPVDIVVTIESDCAAPLLTATDDTSYTVDLVQPTITRAFTLYYPPTTGQADLTGTTATLTTSTFYSQSDQPLQYSATMEATLSYAYASDFVVTDVISGDGFANVSCDNDLCDVYCCIKAQWNRYLNVKNVNQTLANEYLSSWTTMIGLAHQMSISFSCGKPEDASALAAVILSLGNCTSGCGCGGTEPQLVVGLSGDAGLISVVAQGNGMTVTSNTVGVTTTYTVSMNSTLLSKLNASYNTVVAAGTGISVAVVTVGDTKTYTVTNTSSITVPNILSFVVDIDMSNPAVIPVITISDVDLYGTAFANTPTVDSELQVDALWLAANNAFVVQAFWDTQAGNVYKPIVNIIDVTSLGANTPQVNIYQYGNALFYFKFGYQAQSSPTGYALANSFSNIKLQITLIA